MNLQCPSCLKPLTVPDQYAGQMMKCPLCSNTFSVPAQGGGGEPLPPLPSAPPVNTPVTLAPPTQSAPPTPTAPPLAPPVSPTSLPVPPVPPVPSRTPSSGQPTGAYEKNCVVYFSPEVMRWFAPVALVLIFVLQFFPWVGLFPGGVSYVTQGAWGAAFGSYTADEDMVPAKGLPEEEKPGASSLMIFYVLLFLPTLALSVATLLLDLGFIPTSSIPPNLQPLLRWRWAAVAGLNVVVFLFLALQILLGFSLESQVVTRAATVTKVNEVTGTLAKKQAQVDYGVKIAVVSKTYALWLAFWLHVLAAIGAVTAFCLHDRPGKPLPRLELSW